MTRLLLLSNSRNYDGGFLDHAESAIRDFLGAERRVLFVPYAGVTVTWDDYAKKVAERFTAMDIEVESIHRSDDPVAAVATARAIAVGGGNTFHLLKALYDTRTLDAIRERAQQGVPYIGWSAGSNVAAPSIRTTNDMPVVEPPSFDALGLVPFQINPHYTDGVIPNHRGETRAERLAEFVEANPGVTVVGLREGSILRVEGKEVTLLGDRDAWLCIKGKQPWTATPVESLAFLMEGKR